MGVSCQCKWAEFHLLGRQGKDEIIDRRQKRQKAATVNDEDDVFEAVLACWCGTDVQSSCQRLGRKFQTGIGLLLFAIFHHRFKAGDALPVCFSAHKFPVESLVVTASYPSLPGLICFKPLSLVHWHRPFIFGFSLSTLQHGSSSSCSLFARFCLSCQEIFQFEILRIGQLPTRMNSGDWHEISRPCLLARKSK